MPQGQAADLCADVVGIKGGLGNDHLRRPAHHDERVAVSLAAIGDELPGQVASRIEPRFVLAAIVHRVGTVDYQDDVRLPGPPAAGPARQERELRIGQGQSKQQQDRRSDRQEEPLLKLNPPRIFAHRGEQELHRGPPLLAIPPPAPQMNQNRQRSGQSPGKHAQTAELPEGEDGRERVHEVRRGRRTEVEGRRSKVFSLTGSLLILRSAPRVRTCRLRQSLRCEINVHRPSRAADYCAICCAILRRTARAHAGRPAVLRVSEIARPLTTPGIRDKNSSTVSPEIKAARRSSR
jgi:hypothetical protein